jgi:sodium-dependent phosphate transporter
VQRHIQDCTGTIPGTYCPPSCPSLQPYPVDPNDKSMGAYLRRFQNWALSGISHDVHKDIRDDDKLVAMHDDAEHFKPETEQVFKYLQVGGAAAAADDDDA